MNSQNRFILRLLAIAGAVTTSAFVGISAVTGNNEIAQAPQDGSLAQQPFDNDDDDNDNGFDNNNQQIQTQPQQQPIQTQPQQPGQVDNDVDNGVRALW